MPAVIIGTGVAVPPNVVTNDDLTRIMDTTDKWILEGARRRLGVDASAMPSNIEHWGNTTSGTLPILYHELREQGRVAPGSLVAFTSFGAGAHWGAVLYREPRTTEAA